MDISERLLAISTIDPDAPAVRSGGRWDTWGEIRARMEALDAVLSAAGVGVGGAVGVVMRNRPALVAAFAAIISTGRCLVPISAIQPDQLVAADVANLGLAALIASEDDLDRAGVFDAAERDDVLVIEAGGDDALPTIRRGRKDEHLRTLPGVAILMPTSGTTGPPKRIPVRYDQVNGALERMGRYSAATTRSLLGPPELRASVTICAFPMAHVSGLWGVMQALAEGRRLVMLERFDPQEWAEAVAEFDVRFATLVPAALRMVLDADVDAALLKSLLAVVCGSAPLDPAVADVFTQRYGVPVLVTYGATEFPGGTVAWTLEDHRGYWARKKGSAGRPRPGISIRIVHPESGEPLPDGEHGLLEIRSPQSTGSAGPDGWVRTNDICWIDSDGFLFVVGRADDAVIRGGFKVLPQEVEEVLMGHPGVAEAAVVGVADERLGEVPVAMVTLTDAGTTSEELETWCRSRLLPYQIPVQIVAVSELPRTAAMKVSKGAVREQFAALRT